MEFVPHLACGLFYMALVPHLAATLYGQLFLAVAKNLMQLQVEQSYPILQLVCMAMGFVPHLACCVCPVYGPVYGRTQQNLSGWGMPPRTPSCTEFVWKWLLVPHLASSLYGDGFIFHLLFSHLFPIFPTTFFHLFSYVFRLFVGFCISRNFRSKCCF